MTLIHRLHSLFRSLLHSVAPIFKSRCFCKISLISIFICFPAFANAQTFALPSTNTTGTYTITWSGGGQQVYIEEEISSGWVTASLGGSEGSVPITKTVNGTYNYRMNNCIWNGRGMSCSPTGVTKSIIVTLTGSATGSDYVTSYTYDELGRLKTTTNPNTIKNTYSYDRADNRTKKESVTQ